MKQTLITAGRTSLILLFTYAGIVKLLDVKDFQSQLYQSPVIPATLVPIVSFALPAYELFLVYLLTRDRYITLGYLLSFLTMLFFSLYLIGLVFFASTLPCACGGILGRMGYPTHIVFNLFFTAVAFALVVQKHPRNAVTASN